MIKVLTQQELARARKDVIIQYTKIVGWDSIMHARVKKLENKSLKRIATLRQIQMGRRSPKSSFRINSIGKY